MKTAQSLDEPVLEDDFPIYADYLYVVDGKVVRSDWHNVTVKYFKQRLHAQEVRRCDMHGRDLLGPQRLPGLTLNPETTLRDALRWSNMKPPNPQNLNPQKRSRKNNSSKRIRKW